MILKRATGLHVFLSIILFSSELFASELGAREYIYLPNQAIASGIVVYAPSPNPRIVPVQIRRSNASINASLDRMEAIQKALGQSYPVTTVSPQPLKVIGKAASNTIPQAETVSLDDIVQSNPLRPSVRIEFKHSIIVKVKNIQNFLSMDEGFIDVQKVDHYQIKITALKYGGTFLNVWDDAGRRTIYVGVVFPTTKDILPVSTRSNEHEQPFRFSYTGDWNTFYYGVKGQKLKRQSYDFVQNYALAGQTPYGFLDTSLSADDFNGKSEISSYTVGLSHIPIEGVDNLDMRGFDASRTLSTLSMPSTRLRGIFSDIVFCKEMLGVSYSFGQKQSYFAFLSQNGSGIKSYIHALKLTLFPSDLDNQISINAAEGSGSQHEYYLAKKVFSIDARKRFLDTYLNAEVATANGRDARIAGVKWKKDIYSSALNFRQINKEFTTVSGLPSNQGETGAIWTTNVDGDRFSEQTILNVYRQYLYFNPDDPKRLNYDASGNVRLPLIKDFWSDTDLFYVYTPGEISPRRN